MTITPRTAAVIVASTRAAAGIYEDRSGPIAVDFLRRMGFDTPDATVVADAEIGAAVRAALARRPAVLLTSGGTGISPDDATVEAVTPFIDRELPGVVHAFYAHGAQHVPTAVLSRAVAGMAGSTFVMTLPGSTGGVRDGCTVLEPILEHIVELAHGTAAHPKPDPDYVAAQTGQVVGGVVTDAPLEPEALAAGAVTQAMGALVRFDGIVRNHDHGDPVAALTYEAHPSAEVELKRVLAEVAAEHPVRIGATHRVGPVPIGELAFVVVAAAAHRGDAFAACQAAADRVKAEVPIWKEQTMADGTTEWVGLNG